MVDVSHPRKIRDDVAEGIKQYITSQELLPGDRLPSENEFAASFSVSRLSVREATKALEFLGIVESRTGVGLTVGQLDLARITDHLGFYPSLYASDPMELIDSRVILETGVLPHVARKMAADPSIYDQFQLIIDKSRVAKTLEAWIALDVDYHCLLLKSSGLSPLMAFGDLLQVFFRKFRDSVRRGQWEDGIDGHQKIIDFLREQDIASAAAKLREHIETHTSRLPAVRKLKAAASNKTKA